MLIKGGPKLQQMLGIRPDEVLESAAITDRRTCIISPNPKKYASRSSMC